MLVLSRKAGERIQIGPEVELTVLGIRKGCVKLGFLGLAEIAIHREELLRRSPKHEADEATAPGSSSCRQNCAPI